MMFLHHFFHTDLACVDLTSNPRGVKLQLNRETGRLPQGVARR
jgi:hypothetical protein